MSVGSAVLLVFAALIILGRVERRWVASGPALTNGVSSWMPSVGM